MKPSTPAPHPRPGTLVPVHRVATISQLAVAEIYRAHTPAMGSPGHFVYPAGATGHSYTIEGLCALVDGLEGAGHGMASKLLACEVARLRQAAVVSANVERAGAAVVSASPTEEAPIGFLQKWERDHEL